MSVDYGKAKKTARERALLCLWDLTWHPWRDLEPAGAGVRYSARVRELKREGWKIDDRPLEDGSLGKEYRLMSHRKGRPATKQVKVYLTEDQAVALTQGIVTPATAKAVADALASFRVNKHKL